MSSKQRRVLGAPGAMDHDPGERAGVFSSDDSTLVVSNDASSPNQEVNTEEESNDNENSGADQLEDMRCPICSETMVSLNQLNRHIDDVHEQTASPDEHQNESNLKKSPMNDGRASDVSKTNRDSRAVSRQFSSSPGVGSASGINRKHYVKLTPDARCAFPGCHTPINPRSNIVNCAKCGQLHCRRHLRFRVRLSNAENGTEYDSIRGAWCICCKNCFYNKPEFTCATEIVSNDLTSRFQQLRQTQVDQKVLAREQAMTRFIKLANHIAASHVNHTKPWTKVLKGFIDQGFQQVVGLEDWQKDSSTMHCAICFVRFTLLIRKHHCRLCGRIVCDDFYGERKNCSIDVPLGRMLEKLENLNYSPLIRNNFRALVSDDSLTFRCCVDCKNDLFYEWKAKQKESDNAGIERLFDNLSAFLIIKTQICVLLPKYESMVKSDVDDEASNNELKRVATKLMTLLRSVESSTSHLKAVYFEPNNHVTVKQEYSQYARLIKNLYQSIVFFLQDKLISFKFSNDTYKAKEQDKIKLLESQKEFKRPSLTKKQIRNLREQLMVLNEQKFMIDNMISDYGKARKFEELEPLEENKKELDRAIEAVETQLGEFSF